jgi:hypothetical protein
LNINIRFTDRTCKKVKVTYKRKEIISFLHTLHAHSKENNEYGLYDIEENTRNVKLFFEFKSEVDNFEKVVDYINSLYNKYLAFESVIKARNSLEEIMKGEN